MLTATELITKTPGVVGGDACIAGHRISVWCLVSWRRMGVTDHTLLTSYYPSLTQADLDAAWEYYERNPAEIDEAILDNDRDD